MLEKLRRTFEKKGACVARAENISLTTTNGRDYEKVIDRLLKTKGATAVVVLLEPKQSRMLIEAASRKKTGSLRFLRTFWSWLLCVLKLFQKAIMVVSKVRSSFPTNET